MKLRDKLKLMEEVEERNDKRIYDFSQKALKRLVDGRKKKVGEYKRRTQKAK